MNDTNSKTSLNWIQESGYKNTLLYQDCHESCFGKD